MNSATETGLLEHRVNRLRIVHVVEGFIGGLRTYMIHTLPRLVGEGHDVTLICSLQRHSPDAMERLRELEQAGVRVYIISMVRGIHPFHDIRSLWSIWRIFRSQSFDVLHTHCSKAGALGRVAGLLNGIEHRIHSAHCFAFLRCGSPWQKHLYHILERILSRITTHFVAVSKIEAVIAKENNIFSLERCTVIHNGLPVQEVSQTNQQKKNQVKLALGLPINTRIVTTACRLVSYKGLHRFIRAAHCCVSKNVTFVIAGEGPLRPLLKQQILDLGLDDKVALVGHIEDMSQIYKISDVIALCSDSEAEPYLLLEAMQAGCPVLGTNVSGIKQLLEPNRGILVQANEHKIAAGIDTLLNDQRIRQTCVYHARAHLRSEHNVEKQAKQLTHLYQSLNTNPSLILREIALDTSCA